MKNFSICKAIIVAFFLTIIVGCSSDSSSSSSSNTITLTLNGVDEVANVTYASLVKSEGSNEKLLEITAENDDYVFEINFFGEYSSDNAMPIGDYIYSSSTVEGFVYISYKRDGNTYGMHFPDNGVLSISSISGSNKKVSGTFTQTLSGGGDLFGETLPSTLTITNGVFNNVSFEIINY